MPLRSPWAWLAVVPPAFLLFWYASNHHYVCLKGEQWGLVPIVDRLLEGELTFDDLWRQKNAHRIFFPKLVLVATVWIGRWNPLHETWIVCSSGVVGACGVLYTLLPSLRLQRRTSVSLVVLGVSAFVLSFSQFENWIWGMQTTVMLCFAASVWGLALIARRPSLPRGVAAAVLGVVATFSLSLGLAFWPVGLLALALAPPDPGRPRDRRWVLVGWCVASVAAIAVFLTGFRRGTRLGEGLEDPAHAAKHLLAYLGNPVAGEPGLAMAAGVFALVLATALVAWHVRHRTAREDWAYAAAWAAFPLVTGVLIGSGRAHFALQQALSSRYITFTNLLWLGVLGLFVAYWTQRSRAPRPTGRQRLLDVAGVLFVAVVLVGGAVRARSGYGQGILVTERVERARDAVLETFPDVPPPVIAVLNFNHPEETLKVYLPMLERHRLSLFRERPDDEREREKEKRRKRRRARRQK